jgi:hypothetical protein
MGRTLFIDEAAAVLGVSRTRCGSQRVLLASIQVLLQEQADKRRADEEERRRLETQTLAL